MRLVGLLLFLAGAVQAVIAAAGFVLALRDAHYDAIAAGTLFDGRWLFAGILASVGAVLVYRWPWMTAFALIFVGFLTIWPVREGLRRSFARRS